MLRLSLSSQMAEAHLSSLDSKLKYLVNAAPSRLWVLCKD